MRRLRGRGVSSGRRGEAAELALDQARKGDGGAILEIRTDDLHPDRQSTVASIDRGHCRRQTGRRRNARPHGLVTIAIGLAVDLDLAAVLVRIRLAAAPAIA